MNKLDILNREEFVERLFNLTQELSFKKKSTSFAIDGNWGVGKSIVLDMYEDKLSREQSEDINKERYFVIRYNCWKYDYYEEPLIAIVSAMIETIEQKTKLFPNNEKKSKIMGALKAVGVSLLSMANSSIRQKTGVDLKEAYDMVKTGINDGAKSYDEQHNYDVYFGFNRAMKSLQLSLKEISSEYTVVFMVDELDRCLPEYAIKVLERLHHLTEEAHNTVMVIAYDKTQLEASVKTLFGFNDCNTYLKKFIQFELKLGYGTISERFTEKHAEYVNLFDKSVVEYEDSLEEFMQAVFKEIEVREQEQLINRAMLIHKLLFDDTKDYSFMCVEILSAVLFSRYKDIKKFCDWFDYVYRVIESGKELPPFNNFFKEKFESVPVKEFERRIGPTAGIYYRFTHDRSLYSAIAYIWYYVYLDGAKGNKLQVEKVELKEILDENVNDLEKFVDTMKIIK